MGRGARICCRPPEIVISNAGHPVAIGLAALAPVLVRLWRVAQHFASLVFLSLGSEPIGLHTD